MLGVFRNAWKVKEIRTKLYFILMMLAVYRLGSHIGLPGIDASALVAQGGDNVALIMMLMGGNPGTIFAMGIAPYITASIIMQLLTVAIPYLERLKKEGEEGRKKINQFTRVGAVFLALLQGSATVFSLSQGGFFRPGYMNPFIYVLSVICLVTGTIFIMWIAELITEKGIGNGASFIITANILASLPMGVTTLWYHATAGGFLNALIVGIVVILFAFIVAFAVLIQEGERRLPVQYSKKMVGKQLYGGQTSYIPIKVNIAGVMSIIFASSLLGIPQLILGFFPNAGWVSTIAPWLSQTSPTGAAIFVILIFCFTFFYTSFAVNPVEMAENMKKNGGAIPGVRSGKPTSDYIQRTVTRMSWIGGVFYSAVALIPVIIEWITGISVGVGGTTLLIVVGVGMELVKQMESQLLTRHYKGFLS